MRRSRKIILIALLAVVVLAGSIGGIALANDNGDEDTPKARCGALLDEVCKIYNENTDPDIDCEALKAAFAEAGGQIRAGFRENIRQRLMDECEMTEEQLDEWKAWMESRPDFPTDEFKEWLESKPDLPFEHGFRHGGFGCFGRDGDGPRFRFWNSPPAE